MPPSSSIPTTSGTADLIGTTVTTPVFGVAVPVHGHPLAEPDKGTGVAMVCTFGDLTDVIWWRELDLPARAVIERDGRFQADAPDWLPDDAAQERYQRMARKAAGGAADQMVEMLRETGELVGEIEQITHAVKFYEKGDKPLEIVTVAPVVHPQRRTVRLPEGRPHRAGHAAAVPPRLHAPPLRQLGRAAWSVTGSVSRQRFFGVPIPVWYRLDTEASPTSTIRSCPTRRRCRSIRWPSARRVSPRTSAAPGGFVGDPDIMDTWATSSLTPELVSGWEDDGDLFQRTFPWTSVPRDNT